MKSRLQTTLKTFCFFIALSVTGGCKPDKLTLEVYSSDVEVAALGQEIIDIPLEVEFSLLGDDEEGLLDRVIAHSLLSHQRPRQISFPHHPLNLTSVIPLFRLLFAPVP